MRETVEQFEELQGVRIKILFQKADELAELHQAVASPRAGYFHRKLLQFLEKPRTVYELEQFQKEYQTREFARHIDQLSLLGLIEKRPEEGVMVRTPAGEGVINVIRRFETRAGEKEAREVFEASCGPNSIRLFLKVYGTPREINWNEPEISFTPSEIGKICAFLPRSIEGIAAIDKLSDAKILTYCDDTPDNTKQRIVLNARLARCFYQYLIGLLEILTNTGMAQVIGAKK